jgi:hypothetical protein
MSDSTSILTEGEEVHVNGRLKIIPGHTGKDTLVPEIIYTFIIPFLK